MKYINLLIITILFVNKNALILYQVEQLKKIRLNINILCKLFFMQKKENFNDFDLLIFMRLCVIQKFYRYLPPKFNLCCHDKQ